MSRSRQHKEPSHVASYRHYLNRSRGKAYSHTIYHLSHSPSESHSSTSKPKKISTIKDEKDSSQIKNSPLYYNMLNSRSP